MATRPLEIARMLQSWDGPHRKWEDLARELNVHGRGVHDFSSGSCCQSLLDVRCQNYSNFLAV